MFFDPYYLLFALPGMILAVFATIRTRVTFAKYSQVRASSGLTGAQAARRLLDAQGLRNVPIEEVGGFLSDHYDPTSRVLRLSPDVYRSPSLSAIGVACHEAGHALQHATGYAWLGMRTTLVPVTQVGTWASYLFFVAGGLLNHPKLILIGCVLFSVAVLFSLITLPVEWNASARAKRLMVTSGIVTMQEQDAAAKVLNAAFMTYVAAAVTALLQLLYYLWRAGLIGGGRRND